ncbi:MAG: UbiH/UbiF/VisC/COQ6 family ubiquinone biosynthesis hydroxylase [Alphaproteobacteria bacterium]|nr:UbiH/UbiF/VisC/COQ6 family ubiquinone biosynthesis hydroxylase [Alphaproteobacteria bacterium]
MAGIETRADSETDLIIVGGGMVGLTLAVAAAAGGLRTAVVDRADPAAQVDAGFDGRTSAIAYGSQRLLDAIGVWPAMAAEAEPIVDIRVSDGDSRLFLHYDGAMVDGEPLGFIVENRVTRTALHAAARGTDRIRLLAPAAVADFACDGAAAIVRLEGGTVLRAPLLVGADGRNSFIRRRAGIAATEWSYPQTGIVCTIAHARSHRGVAHERFLPAGPFAILPMTGNRSSLVWTERADLAPAMMALPDDEFLAEIERRVGGFLGALSLTGPRWSYPLALLHANRYADRRLALIGDAAHAVHPIAGQGLNLGLKDVAALAEVMIDARRLGLDMGADDVLERYARWRRFDNLALIAATDSLNRLFSNDIAPVKLARDLGLAAVNRLPPLKRLFMRHAMGVVGDLPRLMRGEAL